MVSCGINHDKLIFIIFTQIKLPNYPWAFKMVISDIFQIQNRIKSLPNNLIKYFLERLFTIVNLGTILAKQ